MTLDSTSAPSVPSTLAEMPPGGAAPPPATDPPLCQPIGQERQELLEHRKTLIEMDIRASDSLDNAILTLCGGALAISVTLPAKIFLPALGWAQLLFAGALVAQTIALRAGRTSSLASALEAVDDRLMGKTAEVSRVRRRDVTYYLKMFALASFVLGVGVLLIFVRAQSTGN